MVLENGTAKAYTGCLAAPLLRYVSFLSFSLLKKSHGPNCQTNHPNCRQEGSWQCIVTRAGVHFSVPVSLVLASNEEELNDSQHSSSTTGKK